MAETVGYAVLQVIPSVRNIQAELQKAVEKPAEQAGRESGRKAGQELASRAAAAVRQGASQLRSAFETAAQAASVAAAATVGSAFVDALDLSRAQGRIQAQLGVTEAEAGRIGAVAGEVYARGFGENLGEVSDAVTLVVRSIEGMGDASDAELQEVSRQALNLAQTLGVDVNEATRSVANMMRTGLVGSATEAMDLLISGAQLGADEYGDLADTMQEYSTQFRDLGLTGAEAMGLIVQGMEAGAQSSDKVADALKELNIRVTGLEGPAVEALDELGLNAEKMASAFAVGGPKAREALDQILDGLEKVEDPALRDQLAMDLLGTQAEDMADALYNLDLDTAAQGLGDVAGAAEAAADALEQTDAQKFTAAWRQLKQELSEELLPVLTRVADWLTNNMDTVKTAGAAVLGLGAAWAGLTAATKTAQAVAGAWNIGKGIVEGAAAGATALGDLGKRVAPAFDGVRLRAMYAGDAIKSGMSRAGQAVKSAAKATTSFAAEQGKAAASTAKQWAAAAGRQAQSLAGLAKQWTMVAAEQSKAALQATRARVAMIAQVATQKAITAATKAWTVAQRALNLVLKANPIGLIVTAIGLLVAGVIWAYNNVEWFRDGVNAAFEGIKTAALWLWDNALKPMFDGLVDIIQTHVVPVVTWLWTNVIKPAFDGIAAAVSWAWDTVIKPALQALWNFTLNTLAPAILWLWKNVLQPAWKGISTAVSWAWENVIKPAFNAIRSFVSNTLGPIFTWLYANVIKPVWTGIKTAISTAWTGIKVVFGWLKDGVNAVKKAFEVAKDGIDKAWSKLKSITRKPVEFVVNSVYNEGIVPVWNKVAGLVGMSELKKITLKFASGGIMPGYTPGRDVHEFFSPTGGRLLLSGGEAIMRPEFTRAIGAAGVHAINAVARRGGTAGVRRALGFASGGVYPGPVQRFADGGIWGRIADFGASLGDIFDGDALKSAAKKVLDPLIETMQGEFTKGRWAKAMIGVPRAMISRLTGWFKSTIGGLLGGSGKKVAETAAKYLGVSGNPNQFTRAFGMNGQPWCAMFVSEMIREAKAQKAYNNIRSAAVASFANSSLRSVTGVSQARPGDLAVYRGRGPGGWGHINIVVDKHGATIGGNESNSVKRSTTYARRAAKFMRPKQLASGGIWWQDEQFNSPRTTPPLTELLRELDTTTYDKGGWLKPGLTAVYNGTGRPEAVYTAAQQARLDRLIAAVETGRARPGHTINIREVRDGRDTARRVVTSLRDYEVLHPAL